MGLHPDKSEVSRLMPLRGQASSSLSFEILFFLRTLSGCSQDARCAYSRAYLERLTASADASCRLEADWRQRSKRSKPGYLAMQMFATGGMQLYSIGREHTCMGSGARCIRSQSMLRKLRMLGHLVKTGLLVSEDSELPDRCVYVRLNCRSDQVITCITASQLDAPAE